MSRKPQGNILLTVDELTWAGGAIARRSANREALKSQREREIVSGLMNKLEELGVLGVSAVVGEPKFLLKATRNEARYLQKVATEVRSRLEPIILGYIERMPEDPGRYSGYLQRAKEKSEMLLNIVNKVKAAL